MPYRLEVAKRGQARCVGQQPCKGNKIDKGELRLGAWVEIMGHGSFKWRHWGCTTPQVIGNLHKDFEKVEELDGYDELPPFFQEKVSNAWESGHVDLEDIPATAKVPDDEDEPASPNQTPKKGAKSDKMKDDDEKPKAKKGKEEKPKAKKAKMEETNEDEEKPKAKRGKVKDEEEVSKPKAKKSKVKDEEDEEEEKPKAKRGRPKKVPDDEEEKPKPPWKKTKKEKDEDGKPTMPPSKRKAKA